MSFKTHVFISYAHADNPEVGGRPGWVTQFHEVLEPILTSRLRRTKAVIWRDKRLSDNDEFDPVIMKQLPHTAVFLAVVTDNYVYSEWCRREAQAFCELAAQGVGLTLADKQRVFKILKLPPDQQDTLPAPMRKTLGTSFFVREDKEGRESNDELDVAVELDPGYSDEYGKRFRKQIARLAQDIANTLKAIEASDPAAAPSAPGSAVSGKPTVYLAQCGEDRDGDREALRSELVQRGYPVLPDHELPASEAALRDDVARMLERSALSVHLLGTMPGRVPPDSAGLDSELVIQNALAVQRARTAPLRRLVSLPEGTTCPRPNHQEFLAAMLRDADVHGQAEVISGSVEDVKKELLDALKRIETPAPAAIAPAPVGDAAQQTPKLYVILTQDDLESAGDLYDGLENRFNVSIPVFEGSPEANRKAGEERLTECDAVLIYYGAGTDDWFSSVASEVEKSVAWRSGRPFRAVVHYIAGPATPTKKFKYRKHQPNVINAMEEGSAAQSIEAALAALGGAAHG